jgi:hypothetical protein
MKNDIGNRGVWVIGSAARIEAIVVGTMEAADKYADDLRVKLGHPNFRYLQIRRIDASDNRTYVFNVPLDVIQLTEVAI